MTDTITQQTRNEPSNVAKLVRVFSDRGERIEFEDGYIHYIHPEAMEGLTGLTVRGLKNAQIHFFGKIQGEQIYEANYRNDSGVINFVDCQDVRVTNLTVINKHVFLSGNCTTEASCTVNVVNSRMRFERCRFDSMGKNCLSIHSGSYVELDDVLLAGYFYELFVGASEVVAARLQIEQEHDSPDSHSAIWVSSSQPFPPLTAGCQDTKVKITDSVFDMMSGNSLVSGAGPYDTRSTIDFQRCSFTPSRSAYFGVCAFHEKHNSITVTTDFGDNRLTNIPYLDFISTPTEGFAKYISCHDPDTQPGGTEYPRKREEGYHAPVLVDGINSDYMGVL